jgi:thioesterase domain-containing protein
MVLGGVVAFEMARQLREQGAEVGALLLIDSRAPRPGAGRPDDPGLLAAFAADMARGSGGDLTDPALVAELGTERLGRLWEVFRANCRALAEYAPRPYPGQLTLVRAGLPTRRTRRWAGASWPPGGVSVHVPARGSLQPAGDAHGGRPGRNLDAAIPEDGRR